MVAAGGGALTGRTAVAVAAIVVVVAVAVGYLAAAVQRRAAPAEPGRPPAAAVLVVDQLGGTSDVVAVAAADAAARTPTGLRCHRVYAAGGTTSCLRLGGPGPTYELAVFDDAGDLARTVPLPGIPSRTRVSASGRIVAWTVFVTGDSYLAPGGFSTRTGFLDLRTGRLVESLETFAAEVDGRAHTAVDTNYWGVTVAADDRTFYATMASGTRHWLVRGDLEAGVVRAVREGAECPSLSPDGTRVAYKKRTGRLGHWQLAVLDLAAGTETLLPGTDGVDDQAVWLDGATLAYGVPSNAGRPPEVHRVPADGSGAPVLLAPAASSPVPAG